MDLRFNVESQHITRTDRNIVVAKSQNYLKAKFDFSPDWAGKTKTAVFNNNGHVYNVILDNDECFVAEEVIRQPGFTVSVFGGDLITADVVMIRVEASGYEIGGSPEPPTPEVYEQVLGMFDKFRGGEEGQVLAKSSDEDLEFEWVEQTGGGGGGTTPRWGNIEGILSDQTDLQAALNEKQNANDAFSGDYNDLTNKPTLFSGDYNDLTNKPTLFSGDYEDLTHKPEIPTIEANPTLSGTEAQLGGIEIDGIKYAVPSGGGSGTTVVANPTLAGGEDALSSLQVGNTLYKVEGDVTTKLLIDTAYARNRKHDFAWSELPHAMIALVIDDCLPDVISGCVNNAQAKQIPLNMAIIVDKFNQQATNETVLQAIKRGIANGGEALMHGNGIITSENIDDEDYLKLCFLTKKEVAIQNGINPRGFILMGGGGEITGDPRTDRWVRALYDYSDLYGLTGIEPYYHARLAPTSLLAAKTYIDDAVANKKFIVIFAHKWWDWWNDMIDYAKAQGAEFATYAYIYDKYGSTKAEKASEARIKALEDVVYAKALTSISASKAATTYYEGATLDTSDITVEAHFDNGTSADVSGSEDLTIDTQNVDMSTAGTYNIAISYEYEGVTKTTSIPITVEAIPQGQVLDSISASKTTTNYVQNSQLVLSDITVMAAYTNSTTADVTANALIDATNVDMTTVGTYTIPISYSEGGVTKTTSITITVTEDQGTVIYSKSSLTQAVSSSDVKFGTKIDVVNGKKYVYDFDYEITSGGAVNLRAEAPGGNALLYGDYSTGATGHVHETITSTQTRNREPFNAKYSSSAYTVKLTNITIREKN